MGISTKRAGFASNLEVSLDQGRSASLDPNLGVAGAAFGTSRGTGRDDYVTRPKRGNSAKPAGGLASEGLALAFRGGLGGL